MVLGESEEGPTVPPDSGEETPKQGRERAEADLMPADEPPDSKPVEFPQEEGLAILHETYVGTLPHPEHLQRFEDTLPGAADRIISMTEAQSAHRREMETLALKSRLKFESRGQWLAASITLAIVIGGFWVISKGHSLEGVAPMISAMVVLAGVFIFGRRKRNQRSKNETTGNAVADAARIPELKKAKAGSNK